MRGSDTAETIVNANCGWVIDPEDAALLSEKMKEACATDKNIQREKLENALNYGLTHFSKSENLRKLIGVFDDILKQS